MDELFPVDLFTCCWAQVNLPQSQSNLKLKVAMSPYWKKIY